MTIHTRTQMTPSTSSQIESSMKKRVSFKNMVDVSFTYAAEDYDRYPIHCDPLSREDAMEVIRMRIAMKNYTDLIVMKQQQKHLSKKFEDWLALASKHQQQKSQQQAVIDSEHSSLRIHPQTKTDSQSTHHSLLKVNLGFELDRVSSPCPSSTTSESSNEEEED